MRWVLYSLHHNICDVLHVGAYLALHSSQPALLCCAAPVCFLHVKVLGSKLLCFAMFVDMPACKATERVVTALWAAPYKASLVHRILSGRIEA